MFAFRRPGVPGKRLIPAARRLAGGGISIDGGAMDTQDLDILVIGAGMAGASAAAALCADRRVALIEAEEQAGYHSTGRSAAIWVQNYGPPDVRLLSRLSRRFFELPPSGYADAPLMRRRPSLFLATEAQRDKLERTIAEGTGVRAITPDAARAMLPALRPGYAVAAALEDNSFDMDVAAIHTGFLRQVRTAGGMLALRHRAGRIARTHRGWDVETSAGAIFHAPVIVNAAGAWGDEVATLAGVRPIGLTPCRRSAAIIDPAPWDVSEWPLVGDSGDTWYARPEARTRLMVSPADATPTYAHDVRPDELDIATAIARMQEALAIEVRRIEHSWAGLRSFTPDGSLCFGWDPVIAGFFWCVGQGGYGSRPRRPRVGWWRI